MLNSSSRVMPAVSTNPVTVNLNVNSALTNSQPQASSAVDSFEASNVNSMLNVPAPEQRQILRWSANNKVWHCHWFPMRETNTNGGDAVNNLYAKNGALDKYDRVFGRSSRAHELQHNRVRYEDVDKKWFGHCDKASLVSLCLKEPKRDVVYNGVNFTKNDIAGLCCMVSDNLVKGYDFKGNRCNSRYDNPKDPAPHVFLGALQKWCREGMGFAMDVTPTEEVWNYPYDNVEVSQLRDAPEGAPVGHNVAYYDAWLWGTNYDNQQKHYRFWINYNSDGSVASSDWLAGEDLDENPDFLWKPIPRGDLTKDFNWMGVAASNPYVFAQEVFAIYSMSI